MDHTWLNKQLTLKLENKFWTRPTLTLNRAVLLGLISQIRTFSTEYWPMSCESADREYHLEWFSPAVYLGFLCFFLCSTSGHFVKARGLWPPDNIYSKGAPKQSETILHLIIAGKGAEGKLMPNYGYKTNSMSLMNQNSFSELKKTWYSNIYILLT